jgi:tRNA A22 N-methylase
VQEFQDRIESCIRKGFLPQMSRSEWSATWIYEAYREIDHKQAKLALIIQLAEVLVALRLRNPTKRFEKIIERIGIEKSFAYELLVAYTNPMEGWELKNG